MGKQPNKEYLIKEIKSASDAYRGIKEYFSREGAVLAKEIDLDAGAQCHYRDENGNKCAVGCLIPDELYDKKHGENERTLGELIENTAVCSRVFLGFPELKALVNGDDEEGQVKLDFLTKAQNRHDDALSVNDFLEGLDSLADEFGIPRI